MKFVADREDSSQPQTNEAENSRKPSTSEGYTPPTNLYAFPPNIDAVYPPPGETRKPISISSYLPNPSGPTNYPIYPGPITPKPDEFVNPQLDILQSINENSGSDMDTASADRQPDDAQIFEKPPPGFSLAKKPDEPPLPLFDHNHDHHDHDHYQDHNSGGNAPFAPYDDSLKHLHGFEAFPGIHWFHLMEKNSSVLVVQFEERTQNPIRYQRDFLKTLVNFMKCHYL